MTIPANKFHDALTAAKIEYAGLSWNGFNLFGNRQSIEEAKRMMHSDSILPTIREQLLDATRLSHEWMKKHDHLLGFIQKRPEVLKELIEQDAVDPQ